MVDSRVDMIQNNLTHSNKYQGAEVELGTLVYHIVPWHTSVSQSCGTLVPWCATKMYHSVPWCATTLWHTLPWCATTLWHTLPWCAMVCLGVPWCAMVCHNFEAHSALVYHGVPWCAMVCHGVPWCRMMYIRPSIFITSWHSIPSTNYSFGSCHK